MTDNRQFSVDEKYVKEALFNRLSVAQNEIINLEALATQLLAQNKELEESLTELRKSNSNE